MYLLYDVYLINLNKILFAIQIFLNYLFELETRFIYTYHVFDLYNENI